MIKIRAIILFLLACLWALDRSSFADEASGFVPRQAVVLLTNGELLRGKVSLAGDQYFVGVPEGEIRLPVKRVQSVCDTVDDVYLYLARSSMGSLEEHLELASWCLRHELLGYAAKELSAAMALDANHPRIALFARRLELAHAELKKGSAEREPAPVSNSVETEKSELGAVVLDLPEGGVAEFTARLQPLLMNKCAAAGCHGSPTESGFRLIRTVGGRNPTRGQTQQNLISVLQQLDKERPANSPLLTKPLDVTHGGLTSPIFSDQEQAQYDRLVEFANLVGDKPDSPSAEEAGGQKEQFPAGPFPAEMQRPQPAGSPTDMVQGVNPGTEPREAEGQIPLTAEEDFNDTLTDEAMLEAFEANPIRRGAAVDRYTPVDEFDAEIFNRRFFPQSKATVTESPSPE